MTLQLDEFLPYRMSFTSNLVSGRIADAYEALFGLSIPEWRLVAVIAEHADITQQDIAVRTRMDKVVVSRAAASLVQRGLIGKRPHASDRRAQCLFLTEAGRTLYDNVVPKARALEAEIFACLAPSERATLVRLLRRIDAHVLEGDG